MAHFAQLDDTNTVIQVIVVSNDALNDLPFPESEPVGIEFCLSLYGADTIWKQTSYNAAFRANYAGVGFVYDFILDAFISPKPYQSWLLNTTTCQWEAPIPYPTDGNWYFWDEDLVEWVETPPRESNSF